MKANIAKSVSSLINSGQANIQPQNLFMPTMAAENIWDIYKHRFSSKSIKDVERTHSLNILHQYNAYLKGEELGRFVATMTKLGLNPKLPGSSYGRIWDDYCEDKIVVTRQIYQTRYIGVLLEIEDDFDKGIHHMINIVDDLSLRGYVKGNLASLMEISLDDDRKIIVSYLLFDGDGIKYLEDNKIDFPEGGIPSKLP